MKKYFLIIGSILVFILIVSGLLIIYMKNRITYDDYIKVADYVFEKYDDSLYEKRDYEYKYFLQSIDDDEIGEIVLRHRNRFAYMTVSDDNQVTFEDAKIHFLGHSGIAVIRNDIMPVESGKHCKPKEAVYKQLRNRIYKYHTSGY